MQTRRTAVLQKRQPHQSAGSPKTFDELRHTAEMIASEMVPGPDGKMISRGELLLRNWIKSKNPILQRSFVEYWVGKVPDKIESDGLEPRTVLRLYYAHEEPGYAPKVNVVRLPSGGGKRRLEGS